MPAITTQQAEKSKLALFINKSNVNSNTVFVLYDAGMILNFVNDFYEKNAQNLDAANIEYAIKAMLITIKPRYTAYNTQEVANSAAEKRYGPLIYNIAMAYNNGLIPDRYSVSSSAENIWNNFYKRNDIEHKQIDDVENPKTKTKFDDEVLNTDYPENHPVNQAYFTKNSPNINALLNNNKVFFKIMHDLNSNIENTKELLYLGAKAFFEQKTF